MKNVVERFGRLDILVNNAGVSGKEWRGNPANNASARERLFDVNVSGVAAAVTAAEPYLGEGGRIINIGSILGERSLFPGVADYAATKGAVVGLHQRLGARLRRARHHRQQRSAGPDQHRYESGDGELADALRAFTALGRYGKPEEVAAAVAFLASPAASLHYRRDTECRRRQHFLGLQFSSGGPCHDRTETFRRPRRRRPWLAQGEASFLLRPLLRPRAPGAWSFARVERR